jgi:hypothetical protein
MVVHILFHQRAGKTMRDDPDAVSFGEVPNPIPCNASFGAHVGKAAMTNYQNVQVFHLRSFQNVGLRAASFRQQWELCEGRMGNSQEAHSNVLSVVPVLTISSSSDEVHMKSILRKIQVASCTQATVWVLEHGLSTDEIIDRLLTAAR